MKRLSHPGDKQCNDDKPYHPRMHALYSTLLALYVVQYLELRARSMRGLCPFSWMQRFVLSTRLQGKRVPLYKQ